MSSKDPINYEDWAFLPPPEAYQNWADLRSQIPEEMVPYTKAGRLLSVTPPTTTKRLLSAILAIEREVYTRRYSTLRTQIGEKEDVLQGIDYVCSLFLSRRLEEAESALDALRLPKEQGSTAMTLLMIIGVLSDSIKAEKEKKLTRLRDLHEGLVSLSNKLDSYAFLQTVEEMRINENSTSW